MYLRILNESYEDIEWEWIEPLIGDPIKEIEIEFDFKLPQDFKAFVYKYNNASPVKHYCIRADTNDYLFCGIYDFNKQENPQTESAWVTANIDRKLSKTGRLEYFGFGRDPFGNQFVFGRDGKIYFWEHEEDNYYYICDSFTEFINMLVKWADKI